MNCYRQLQLQLPVPSPDDVSEETRKRLAEEASRKTSSYEVDKFIDDEFVVS
jgi:hypothetical protein